MLNNREVTNMKVVLCVRIETFFGGFKAAHTKTYFAIFRKLTLATDKILVAWIKIPNPLQ